jgi:glucose/arabinose dehydrogenase
MTQNIMKSRFLIFSLFVNISTIYFANCQTPENASALNPFASGLINPVCIANAGDSRLFVVNQKGSVCIVDSAGNVDPQQFIDISDRVLFDGERGLLGIAFHPDYKTNGYFYVNYVGEGDSTHISRFSTMDDNPDKADSLSEFKLLTIAQPFHNHKGGNLCFGPDGYLYIGMGDGGSGGDPDNRAQDSTELLGKMLRIDVDHGNPYSIPPSNPFYNSSSTRNEIWALGLRNPWRFSFDRLTGDLWIADVGQNQIEEIDFQSAGSPGGENYGWRCYEGNQAYNTDSCNANASYTFPVNTYTHGSGCSVTGGYVYRGDASSSYYGYYFFADYCSDRIWTLHNESGEWIREDFGQFSGNSFSTFGEDSHGQLYIAGLSTGTIYRLTSPATGLPSEKNPSEINVLQYPSSNRIRLEINRSPGMETIISVYDIRGIKHYQAITTDNIYEFTLNNLTPGIYLLYVKSNGKDQVHKLIIGK